jgi:NAD(P)-dependent dehydrogenase (short-subunit alcohol dehydrogenase family)
MTMLEGKTILVIGSGGLLGQAIVEASLAAGANVIAADKTVATGGVASEGRVVHVACDITNAQSVRTSLDAGCKAFGRIDGCVNSAYPRNTNYGRQFLDVSFEDFCENVSLNLGGAFVVLREVVRYAENVAHPVSMVNISSIYGSVAPRFQIYEGTKMTMPVEYAAIKAGLEHLSRYASAYAKGTDIRINCVSPGGISAGQDEQFLARYKEHCRGKGMLAPADVVGAVLFLLSDASRYIVGQNIVVDDGFSL